MCMCMETEVFKKIVYIVYFVIFFVIYSATAVTGNFIQTFRTAPLASSDAP
jgi:hypothetical protein